VINRIGNIDDAYEVVVGFLDFIRSINQE
jgi:hypothetical protein